MSDEYPTAEELQEEFDDWLKEYENVEYIEFSEEAWERVQQLNPRLVWTDHSTCGESKVTAGANWFKNACCWDTFGWYIMANPWDGPDDAYHSVDTSAYLPCIVCNADGEDDLDPNCEECEGDGYINHYFD
jgi:hypothetical protein